MNAIRKWLCAIAACGVALAGALAHAADAKVYQFSIQTVVPTSSLYYGLMQRWAKEIDVMSSGRLKADILAAGAVVPTFQELDGVHNNVVQGAFSWANYWTGKNAAFVLFANVPPDTGMDQETMLAWFYRGDGEKLYNELLHDVMHLKVKAFFMQPMGPDPLGWFKQPIQNMSEFAKFKYRAPPGIPGQTYKDMGVAAVALPGGEIVPAAQRGVIDAAEWIGPGDDRALGLQKIWKYYYLQGLHQQTDVGQLILNEDFWRSLPPDLQEIIRVAVMATIADALHSNIYDNSVALKELEQNDKVIVRDTPVDYYAKFIASSNKITADYAAKDPFFKKVLDSQIAFAKMVYPYHKRVLELYYNMVKTANEQRK